MLVPSLYVWLWKIRPKILRKEEKDCSSHCFDKPTWNVCESIPVEKVAITIAHRAMTKPWKQQQKEKNKSKLR